VKIIGYLANKCYNIILSEKAVSSLAATLEYVIANVIEVSGHCARDCGSPCVLPRHIQRAINADPDLRCLFSGLIVREGGNEKVVSCGSLLAEPRNPDYGDYDEPEEDDFETLFVKELEHFEAAVDPRTGYMWRRDGNTVLRDMDEFGSRLTRHQRMQEARNADSPMISSIRRRLQQIRQQEIPLGLGIIEVPGSTTLMCLQQCDIALVGANLRSAMTLAKSSTQFVIEPAVFHAIISEIVSARDLAVSLTRETVCILQTAAEYRLDEVLQTACALQPSTRNAVSTLTAANIREASSSVNLIMVSRLGDIDAVNRALSGGASTSCMLKEQTALSAAASRGHTAIVNRLLDAGAWVNSCSPLNMAVKNKHVETATLLLDRGADINALPLHQESPLMCAVDLGHEDLVRLLLAKGASMAPSSRSNNGTPLHLACKTGFLNIAELLIYSGANINAKDWHSKMPFDYLKTQADKDRLNAAKSTLTNPGFK
jgi:hypothetical protein